MTSAGSPLLVRRATLDEVALAREIVDEYCEVTRVLLRDDDEQFRHYFEDDSGVWLASFDGNAAIAGCVILRPLPSRAEACEIKRLYVRESYRRMHVADALMDALEGYAAAFGYRHAYLDTNAEFLRAAVPFYEHRGYVVCERYNDNPQATTFMRRSLR